MANPDHVGPYLKPEPRVVSRATKRRKAESDLDKAYAVVDQRDGPYCRVTGRYTTPFDPDARVRREHHHLAQRSLAKTEIANPDNIIVVCAEAHAMFKAGWLVCEGTDARKALRFHWTHLAPPKKRPFEIQSRRRSQRRED